MIEEGASTRRLDVSGWKVKESGISGRTKLARRNIQLVEKKKTTDSSLILHHSEVCLFFVFGCTQINQGGSCLVQSVEK